MADMTGRQFFAAPPPLPPWPKTDSFALALQMASAKGTHSFAKPLQTAPTEAPISSTLSLPRRMRD